MTVPFVPGPNVAELTAVYGFGDKEMSNVLHFHKSSGWDSAGLTALCDNYIGWELASGKAQRSHQVGMVLVKARDLTTQFSAVVEDSDTLPINGAVIQNALPLNVTLALALRTGFAGRSFRGRTYYIGLPTTSVSNNDVDPTILAAIVAEYNGLIAAATGWGTPLGVFSKRTGNAWRTTGVFTAATAYKSDNIVDTQRRRLPGH